MAIKLQKTDSIQDEKPVVTQKSKVSDKKPPLVGNATAAAVQKQNSKVSIGGGPFQDHNKSRQASNLLNNTGLTNTKTSALIQKTQDYAEALLAESDNIYKNEVLD